MKRRTVSGIALTLILVILAVVFSTFPMFTIQVEAEYAYTDFESGFDGWEPLLHEPSSLVQLSTAYARSGTHSVEMYGHSYGNGTFGSGGHIRLPVTSTSELYELTLWVYITERSDGDAGSIFCLTWENEDKVGWNPYGSYGSYVWVRQSEGYQQKYVSYGLTRNAWHKVTIRLFATFGTVSVLLDDSLIVDQWPAFNAGETPAVWDIGCFANYYGDFVMHQYVDDVEVSAGAEPPVSSELLFFDDFDDGVADGWTAALGAWSVINGEYYMDTLGDSNAISTVDQLNLTDCSVETTVRFANSEVGFRAGIVFRDNGGGYYYTFELSNEYDRAALFYYAPSQPPPYGYFIGQNPEYPVQSNVDYTLKVEVKGNTFTGYVNGVEVVSGTDGTLTHGKVGLRGRRADVYFDNFAVSSLAARAITILSPQSKAYAATSIPLTFIVNESAVWMGYSLDDQANITVTGNTTLTSLLEGAHHVVVYANDTAGTMWASDPVDFTVDTTPPTVAVLSPQNTTYTTASVPLTFTVSEPPAWMGYSLDDQANVTISGNTVLTGLTNGSHSVIVYARDGAGNAGASNTVFFTVESPVSGPCAISVVPAKTSVGVGQPVTVTIIITAITDCVGYQLWIDYNATVLDYVGFTFDTDPAHPLSPTQLAPAYDDRVDTDASVPGSVKLATVWKLYKGIPPYSYAGDSVAVEITFKGKATGTSTLVFDQDWTYAVDHDAAEILFAAFGDGCIAVGGMPTISLAPSTTVARLGQAVAVTVTISTITDCAGYQFVIDYNAAILTLDSWTFDTGTPMTPSQMAPSADQRLDTAMLTPGHVRLATVWKAGVPAYSGSGVAAQLTFTTVAAGNATLAFDPYQTKAVDSNGMEISFVRFDGGWVLVPLPGDVDGDHDVDVVDQRRVQLAMFAVPGQPNWNPNADIDGNGKIDVIDQRIQCLHMFESW